MRGTLHTPLDDSAGDALTATVDELMIVHPAAPTHRRRLVDAGESVLVRPRWGLCGGLVPFLSGTWIVELFIDTIGASGTKIGKLGTESVPHRLNTRSPAQFEAAFTLATSPGDEGIYRLLVTIGLSLTGQRARLSELYGYVESHPIRIQGLDPEPS